MYTPESLDDMKDWLCEREYEDTVILENPDYLSAITGITEGGVLIYDYDLMAEHLQKEDGMSIEEAYEFIDYNTIRALPYMGDKAPIIAYPLNGV